MSTGKLQFSIKKITFFSLSSRKPWIWIRIWTRIDLKCWIPDTDPLETNADPYTLLRAMYSMVAITEFWAYKDGLRVRCTLLSLEILNNLWGLGNRVSIGFSYSPVWLHGHKSI
jgi:hypothetical protein